MLPRFCQQLEQRILHDPGQRGVHKLFVPGELFRVASDLSACTRHVVLGTGFPVTAYDPPTESDGPGGCMVFAYSLLKQCPYRKVTIVYDGVHEPVIGRLTGAFNEKFSSEPGNANIPQRLRAFNTASVQSSKRFFSLPQFQDIEHMIAVELSGPNIDGKHKSMRNVNITDRCGITAELFDFAFKNNVCRTTGVGDGGNEVGMGNVMNHIHAHIPHGEQIACAVKTNFLLAAGVSNWGIEALSFALHLHDVMQRNLKEETLSQIYCSQPFHEDMYMLTAKYGAADPIRDAFDGGVDGMEYRVHKEMWNDLIQLTVDHQKLA